jgi:hypothetical protein
VKRYSDFCLKPRVSILLNLEIQNFTRVIFQAVGYDERLEMKLLLPRQFLGIAVDLNPAICTQIYVQQFFFFFNKNKNKNHWNLDTSNLCTKSIRQIF